MRLGLFLGSQKRNDNYILEDPRPLTNYGNDVHTGDAGKDGYTRLAQADPDREGERPSVGGTKPAYRGPDQSFEQ